MSRCAYGFAAMSLISFGIVFAQQGDILRGKIKKVDADRPSVTIARDGGEKEYMILDQTRFLGAPAGATLQDRVKMLKVGEAVQFKPGQRDGKDVLIAIKTGPVQEGKAKKGSGEKPAPFDTGVLKTLTDLGPGMYKGFEGGLYPGGKNERPAAHEKAGLDIARTVQPLDAAGKPSPGGKIVILSIGMSNTTQVSQVFLSLLAKDKDKNPALVFVDGAIGGQTAFKIQDDKDNGTGAKYWQTTNERLKAAGVTPAQVQAVWMKQADARPNQAFPKHAKLLEEEMANIVRVVHQRFPNCKLAYISGRTYGGYATTTLNPEPYAYESNFAVRWLIERQIKGDPTLNFDSAQGAVKAPWLSWGPYLWANGATKNAYGLSYDKSDYRDDGTHPSDSGRLKIAQQLLTFFKTDSTARDWFRAPKK